MDHSKYILSLVVQKLLHMAVSLRFSALPTLLLLIFCRPGSVSAQEAGPLHQIQAVVDGLETGHQARQAGEVLRTRKDVSSAHFDPGSRNMLVRILPGSDLDRPSINALLAPLGLTVRCVHRKEVEDDQLFEHLDPSTCQDATPNK